MEIKFSAQMSCFRKLLFTKAWTGVRTVAPCIREHSLLHPHRITKALRRVSTTHNVYIYRGKPRGRPVHVPRRARPWTPMKASDTAGAWWRCRTGRRVKTLGFRFQVSGLRFQGAGIKAKISGSRVKRSAFGAQSFGLRV